MLRRLAVLAVFALLYAIPAVADNYTLAGAGGNWSNNATWLQNAVPAVRAPGSLAGTVDTVNLTASVYTVTLDTTTVENVTLTMTCPSSTSTCLLDIPTGNTLLLSGGSNIGADANLQISGGTIANTGTLTLAANSDLDFTSGDLRGAGTTNVNASAAFNANGGGNMAISASQIVNVFGDFVYVNGLVQLDTAARINIKSGGAFDIQTANGISTNDAVNTKITVESGGLFEKTADPFGTNIDPPLDNNGTVRVDTSVLVISTGTHTGVFDMNGAATGFEFANTNNFNGTSGSIQGLGLAKIGGPFVLGAGADLDITNADTDSFASISGSGTINFSGTFNFRGGTISTATINMLGGSTLNVTADNNAVLTSSAHVTNAGTINVSPGAGILSINSGAHITNNNDINLLGDVTINSDGLASARIDNNPTRTIDKTAGATFAAVNVAVNNAGSVNATSGVLKFTKGGSQTGSFFTGTSCGISFDGGTHQFTGAAALTGTGTYFAAAGLVDIDVPITLGGAISFQQSGGLLTGSGTLTVNGPYIWSAGTQDNSSGSGQTVISGNTSQFTTNATITLSGRTFVNNGTLAYNPSAGNYLTINNGGVLTNNGVFNYAGDVPINSNGVSTPSFTNGVGGVINKSTGASTAQIFPFFTGNGTINLSSGTITLSGGGQNLGTVNFTSASNKIIVDNTTLTINTSPTITGNGYLTINGGSGRLQLLAPLTLENIELLQGQIDSGNLTVNTTLVWKSGTMLGPGTTTLFTATLDHSAPTGTTLLDGRTLTLDGSTFNYAANGFGLTLRNGSTINNNSGSLFDSLDAGNVLVGGTGPNTINNATGATLRKSGGAGGTRLDVVVANAGGTIASQVSGQSLIINGGGTMTSGTLTTNAGALLDIFGGTFTYTGGLITGSGAVRILGSGTLQFNASAVASTTIQLETGGTLDVANTFILAVDNVNWLGGTVQGGGQTRTLAGVISNVAPTTLAAGHLFETLGTFDYSADTTNYLTSAGTFLVGNAGGILRFTTDGRMAGTGTLRNRNIIRKTGGSGISIVDLSLDGNTDSIELATAGTIRFTNGGAIVDTLLDTGSGTFDFSAGTMLVLGTSTIGGTGTIQISGATVNFDSAVTAPNLQFTAGALGGSGAFHIGGGKWVGGDMNATGTTFVDSGASFELSTATPKKLRRNFVNNGTLFTQNLPAAMTFENGATMTNNNLVELGENTNFFCNCTPVATFVNAAGATLHQFNAAGTSNYLTKFDNNGTVDLDTGILFLLNGGTHTGAFTPGANTYMAFNGGTHTMSAATSITGGGAVGFNATSSTFDGTLSISGPTALLVVDGGATFNSATTISTTAMEIRSGTVDGSANIDVTGNAFGSSWLAGTITGTGAFTIGPGTPFDFSATTGAITLDGRTITNNGTINYTSASNPFALTNNASIQNNGTFSVQTDTAINAGIGANTILNSGTFEKITAIGNTLIAAATTNTNFANFTTGTTTFNGGYTQNAGTTTIASGATLASPLTINLNGGTLTGTGIVAADLNNGATVAPGMSPGLLQINGDYAQTASGILNIEIAGVNPGVTYDQLGVSGTATLNGTLNASYIGGFVPTDGNTFDVLTFASSSGTFSTENLPTFASGGTTTSSYLPSSYRLTAVVTQADLAIAQTSSGTTLHGQNATFIVTVTNNGPDSTGGVSVTDTYSGGTFVSATSTIGTCSNTTPIVCTIGTLTSGQSATITIVLNGSTVGTITNSASVTGNEFDPNNANNATGTSSVNVVAAADLDVAINESADPVSAGASMNYVVTVVNFGPDNAASFNLALSMTNGSIVSTSSVSLSCSGSGASATCSAASLNVGTHSVTVNVTAPLSSNFMSLTATGSSATADPSNANNSQTEFTSVDTLADLSITKTGPATLTAGGSVTYTIKVKNIGPATATSVIVSDPTPNRLSFDSNSGDCTTAFPCNLGTLSVNQTKTIFATYDVNGGTEGQPVTNTATVTSATNDGNGANNSAQASAHVFCPNTAPVSLAPANNATVPAHGTLSWNGNGDDYVVYLGPAGTGCTTRFGATSAKSLPYALEAGRTYEWRVESRLGACGTETSACVTFTTEQACSTPVAPLASVVGQTTSAKEYSVTWDIVPGATRYEIDEATFGDFGDAQTQTTTEHEVKFKHTVIAATAYFYRVRAFNDCSAEPGPYSPTVRVVISPLPPRDRNNRNVNVPFGTTELILQEVFVAGTPGVTAQYSASTDRPWLTVRPAIGLLPPEGVTLEVVADPKTLPNGTFTASVIVVVTTPDASGVSAQGTVFAPPIPVSISLVTPVTPVLSKDETSQYALVIPTVGHLDGINSHWQSDVRVTNAGFKPYRYRLTFTPAGGTSQGVKETEITVDAGATTALDDIINNWYGLGALNDGASGMLEIVPLDEPEIATLATVASSRTYNVTNNGTLGQYIPALRFTSFIGRALESALPQLLSIQQIAENGAYRTNVGVAEGSGNPASIVMSVFNGGGTRLLDLPMQLAAGEQRQLNSLLAQNGITLSDGRVEVQVVDGSGKVTAYASVVDNNTRDPLAVTGTLLTQSGASRFVLPGVANLTNPSANWRTDMRVFNYGSAAQSAVLTFYPLNNAAPISQNVTLNAGAVMTLDNVVSSLFGASNTGGVVHLATPQSASLVVTGRTYNDTGSGTYGQFIPAVTPDDATGVGGRTLHILQVEDSVRYRTNLGLAEVTGNPVTVEVQVVLPDSKVTPTVQIPLAANEFRQFAIIRELGVGSVYNGRITIRVIDGAGRVTAYGSVIDELTQDPTYVPAQ